MQTRIQRLPLLAVAIISLIIAMWSGLIRIGWQMSIPHDDFLLMHGPLMVCGFLGTLIIVERSVALTMFLSEKTRYLPYVGAILTALGASMLIVGIKDSPAPLFITFGSLGLVLIFVFILSKHTTSYTIVMALGAVSWFFGNLVWLAGEPFAAAVPWWMGFLTFTIAGERLELSRMANVPKYAHQLFVGVILVILTGLVLTRINPDAGGIRVLGLGHLLMAIWLLRYDIARKTIKKDGLPRFVAACLLSGYVWLIVSGLIALEAGNVTAGVKYDAMLHTLFLGFSFSMIFGHAPIIFPAILDLQITFHKGFYAHLILLHFSLALRVSGDLLLWDQGRRWGGLLNVAVIIIFLVSTVQAIIIALDKPALTRKAIIGAIPIHILLGSSILMAIGSDLTTESIPVPPPFRSTCTTCHGPEAEGIAGLGKTLIDNDFINSMDDTELRQFILTGRPVWDEANTTNVDMPPKGGNPALSDEDIEIIIEFLRSIQ